MGLVSFAFVEGVDPSFDFLAQGPTGVGKGKSILLFHLTGKKWTVTRSPELQAIGVLLPLTLTPKTLILANVGPNGHLQSSLKAGNVCARCQRQY